MVISTVPTDLRAYDMSALAKCFQTYSHLLPTTALGKGHPGQWPQSGGGWTPRLKPPFLLLTVLLRSWGLCIEWGRPQAGGGCVQTSDSDAGCPGGLRGPSLP